HLEHGSGGGTGVKLDPPESGCHYNRSIVFITQPVTRMYSSKSKPAIFAAITSFAIFPLAHHASAQVLPPETAPWETTAAAGFTLTQGNSDTLLVTASILGVKKWDKNEA